MRKWFLATVLFALGLAVLLWATRNERQRTPRREGLPNEVQDPGKFTNIPGGGGMGTGLHLDGALSIVKRAETGDTRHNEYTLVASDVDFLEGDTYDVHDLVLRLFDPLTDKERARLTSPLTRLRLPVGADGKPGLAGDEPVRFNNAELLLEQGGPIVPLTLSMPLLEWTPATGLLRSNDRVQLSGPGLTAEGSGLDASQQRADLRLLRDGSVDLVLENGAHASLRSTGGGPFEIRKLDAGAPRAQTEGETLEVHVTGGAKLVVDRISGTEPLEIKSDDLRLTGVHGLAGAKTFRLIDAQAKGAVVATSRGDSFESESAHWSFDELGRLTQANLEGKVVLTSALGKFGADAAEFHFAPDGRILTADLSGNPTGVVELGQQLPKPARELAGGRAHLSGAGPLTLDLRSGTHVEMQGPAHLSIPEQSFELDATEKLTGNIDSNQQTGSFVAEGDTRAAWRTSEVKAPRLDLRYALGTEHGDVVGAITTGHTSATLALEQGEPIELVAENGLEARSIAGKLTIPLARGVDLKRKGKGALQAAAQVVRDFDYERQSFSAEGEVHFEDANGRGDAERVVASNADDHDFFGSARSPARWEVVQAPSGQLLATAQAVEIHVRANSMDATGWVQAQLESSDAHYRLGCDTLHLERLPEAGVDPAQWRSFRADANGAVHARSESQLRNLSLDCEQLVLRGQFASAPGSGPPPELVKGDLEAHGGVNVDWVQAGELHGEGENFSIDAQGRGRLWAPEGVRVRARGRLPGREQPYQLDADWIEFDQQHLDAQKAALALSELQGGKPATNEDALLLELSTDRLHADKQSLHLDGQAHAVGRARSGQPWTIDADDIVLRGEIKKGGTVADDLSLARATGSVHVQFGERLDLRGDTLEGLTGRLRVEGHPAVLQLDDTVWESAWIEYDPINMLVATARGTIRARDQRAPDSWSVEYESLQPFDQEDTSILVLHNPIFHQLRKEMRANWALFWVDREEWRNNTRGTMRRRLGQADLHVTAPEPPAEGPPPRETKKRFAQLRDDPLARILSEVYVEGEVELIEKDEKDPRKSLRRARADAFYLDLRQGMGWLQNADLVLDMPFHGRGIPQSIRAKAAWMRVDSEFSLLADDAVLTSCEYDEPHYRIETGHLHITTDANGRPQSIEARQNAMRFGESGLRIPLPALNTLTDDRGNPFFLTDFIAGNSSQFGASVRATVNLTLGSVGFGLGELLGGILRVPTTDLQGHWKVDIGILGSRGLLLGAGLVISIKNRLRVEAEYSFIPDSQRDRGLVQVPESDRDLLRQWFRMRARRFFGQTEWLDVAFSWQSDPGMQAEFFERDYLSYEQKDVYLHWRLADNSTYWAASVKPMIEDRTDIEELPKAGWYLGRHPVFRFLGHEVLYSAQANAGYYQRHEGDPNYYLPFADGGGERDIARADTEQRLEMPLPLGFAGVRATPYVLGRATAWSASSDGYTDTTRAVLQAGVELATTFWKRYSGGTLSTLSPRVAAHGDKVDQQGADPLEIDQVEHDQTGEFVDLGLRARWWNPQSKKRLDVDLTATHAWDVDNQPDQWQPVGVLGEYMTFIGDVPFGVTHDGRYSPETSETVYSRSYFGFRPLPQWGIEFGYHHGRDETGERIYEATSVATRYHATTKWEFELSETLDLVKGEGLDHQFTLRRLGHDFVLEIGFEYQSGAGSSFGLRLTPNVSYRRSSLGLIDRWLGQDQ